MGVWGVWEFGEFMSENGESEQADSGDYFSRHELCVAFIKRVCVILPTGTSGWPHRTIVSLVSEHVTCPGSKMDRQSVMNCLTLLDFTLKKTG